MNNSPDDFAALIDLWLAFLKREAKSPHTIAAYGRNLRHFAAWLETTYGQPCAPTAVIRRDVTDYQASQQTAGAKPATINNRLAAVSRFFKWAVAQGHVTQDPTVLVKAVRLTRRQPQSLSAAELRRLLRAVHQAGDGRDIAIMELLAGTGLRVSETVQLRYGDIELNTRSGMVTVRRGKGGVHRQVPLTAEVRRALAAYLEQHPGQAEAPLWVGQRGPLRDRGALFRIVNKYALAAGLPALGPHTLRHTFATRYLQAHPGDLRNLAAILGHSSLDTVLIYTEPTTDELAQRMEEAELGNPNGNL
ncbi:MAG: tyrosine-type recombinase/integrase [Chloroflexi bacterium]|nr:tyrosine-type recombinase/integrase [Chloroflexota bacterium]MBU1746241.1 tyrosine-type recombinase/integrase [Chloroflexota bacterium]